MSKIVKILEEQDKLLSKELEVSDPKKYKNLIGAIKSWMGGWPAQSTYTDVLRASQLYFTCPREFVLNYWQPVNNKSFDYKAYLMMSTGTHIHHYLQNYVLGPMGVLYGNWKNTNSKEIKKGFHPDPEKAIYEVSMQKQLSWEYVEIRVFDEDWRIAGHIDGQLDLAKIGWLSENYSRVRKNPKTSLQLLQRVKSGELINLEIKTTGKYMFDGLVDSTSIPEYYKMQAEIYQKLTGCDKTIFWYISRDTMEPKVIVYNYTSKWWEDARRKARIIWKAIKNETLPTSAMACMTPKDKRAKECAFRTPCWDEMDFSKYVREGKQRAEKEGRKLLDLSGASYD